MNAPAREMRLNGWQRIGIVVSVAWAVGSGLWGFNAGYNEAQRKYDDDQCKATASQRYGSSMRYSQGDLIRDYGKCDSVYAESEKAATSNGWTEAVLLALLPIPLGWLGVYKSIALFQWIREGFATRKS